MRKIKRRKKNLKPFYETELGVLYYGKCLDIMPHILNKSIDMVLADPPYGMTKCKWDSIIPFEPMWEQLRRITKPKGAIALFGSEPFSSALRMSNIKNYKYDWIWNKKRGSNIFSCDFRPHMITENISVFVATNNSTSKNFKANKKNRSGYISFPIYYPIMEERDKIMKAINSGVGESYRDSRKEENKNKVYTYTHRYPKNIIEISNSNRKGKLHPNQKPVALMEYLIKTYTNENETILDFCAGSGTTAIACENLNRKWILIEKKEEYCKIITKRLKQNNRRTHLRKNLSSLESRLKSLKQKYT